MLHFCSAYVNLISDELSDELSDEEGREDKDLQRAIALSLNDTE